MLKAQSQTSVCMPAFTIRTVVDMEPSITLRIKGDVVEDLTALRG